MGIIRVLSDQVANKIAAGEVVERPAAVVKELMENALDAGAKSIRLEIEGGGRTRIRITDDGCGMVRDDALLALERHATSKLRDLDDLDAIATLGFRGEALPSIGAVSRLTVETAPRQGGAGTRIQIAAGVIKSVEEAGLPPGTAITVTQLFLNLPARKKFLKSEATELGHITTLATHYALAYPEIQFRLETPHRALLDLPPVASHAERLEQVLGQEMRGRLIEFSEIAAWPAYEEPDPAAPPGAVPPPPADNVQGLGMFGFVSRPELHKLNRNSIYVFVNRRLVRDRLLQHAISAAYFHLLPNNVYPAVLLFLDLPYSEVDVNVHPSKTEVRFRRQGFVHDAVRDAIRQALGAARPVPSFLEERQARATAGAALDRPWRLPSEIPVSVPFSPGVAAELGIAVDELPPGFHLTAAAPEPQAQALPLGVESWTEGERPAPRASIDRVIDPAGFVPETGAGCGLREFGPAAAPDPGELSHLRALGQIRDSFIVAAGTTGLWLIDQHVAHERVLFEQIGEQRRAGAIERQGLLMPMVVELDPGRWIAFAEIAPELAAVGFDAEPFGRHSVAIKAAPAGISSERIERLLQELLQIGVAEERSLSLASIRTRIAATIACHAAIKVNMRLEKEKMDWLLQALARTEYPMTCPHGRPVSLRYSIDEIQRAFKRIK